MSEPVKDQLHEIDVRAGILGLRHKVKVEKVAKASVECWVRTVSAAERDELEESLRVKEGKKQKVSLVLFRGKVLALCVCDGQGKRQFSDKDVGVLAALPGVEVEPIFDHAMKLNGLKTESVEDAEGN